MTEDAVLLRVASVRSATPSSLELLFAAPAAPLGYRAGQHLSFHVPIAGRTFTRPYSLVGSPACGDPLAIIVERIPGGLVSGHLHACAAPGLLLSASGPQGSFFVEPRLGGRHVVMVGGGCGIVPLHAMARELLHGEPETTVSLLYCNVDAAEVILRERLDRLAAASRGRFRAVHVLERDAVRHGALPGPLSVVRATALLWDLAWDREDTEFYICGPPSLMALARAALRELGIPTDRVFHEHLVRTGAVLDEARTA